MAMDKVKFLKDVETPNLVVQGDLIVNGSTVTESAENLLVRDAVIVVNSGNEVVTTNMIGTVYRTGAGDYAIVYNNDNEAMELGYGIYDEAENTFTFNENEGKPIAIRDMQNDKTIPVWDEESHSFIDSPLKVSDGNTTVIGKFQGDLTGNADTATKATQDGNGNVISDTYLTKVNAENTYLAIDDCPVEMGSGSNSIEQKNSHSYAVSNYSAALGDQTKAGFVGYYVSSITYSDSTYKVYLSTSSSDHVAPANITNLMNIVNYSDMCYLIKDINMDSEEIAYVFEPSGYGDDYLLCDYIPNSVRNLVNTNKIVLHVLNNSHILGEVVFGHGAFAAGRYTRAYGYGSAALGEGTVSRTRGQVVVGRYNLGNENAVFVVGNGEIGSPNTALEVLQDGTTVGTFKGDLTGNVIGNLIGNADTATTAMQDINGNDITSTYATIYQIPKLYRAVQKTIRVPANTVMDSAGKWWLIDDGIIALYTGSVEHTITAGSLTDIKVGTYTTVGDSYCSYQYSNSTSSAGTLTITIKGIFLVTKEAPVTELLPYKV